MVFASQMGCPLYWRADARWIWLSPDLFANFAALFVSVPAHAGFR